MSRWGSTCPRCLRLAHLALLVLVAALAAFALAAAIIPDPVFGSSRPENAVVALAEYRPEFDSTPPIATVAAAKCRSSWGRCATIAVNGVVARQIAYATNSTLCGSTMWACRNSQAPAPACFGRGLGTWECYGGVTEQHKVLGWKWRNCATYHYVDRYGGVTGGKYNCR